MRAFSFVLLLWLSSSTFPLCAKDTVFVPRSWMNVEELLGAVRTQTQIPHTVLVPDTMGKMVLYDNLTDAEGVRDAVWEYYVYVLGQMVRWDKEGHEWFLRRHWDLDLPVAMDLPALEEALVEKKKEILQSFQSSVAVSKSSVEDLPPWEDVGEGGPQMDEVSFSWWQRMVGVLSLLWETSDQDMRAKLRRQWKLDVSMGRVPLVEFVMGGDVDFKMGGQVPQISTGFSMSPKESVVSRSDLDTPQREMGTLGTMTQLAPVAAAQPISKNSSKAPRWPKKILSFSTKSWWALLLEKRSTPQSEPAPVPLSPRVLERREQAEKWFDVAKKNHEQMRAESRVRRERKE